MKLATRVLLIATVAGALIAGSDSLTVSAQQALWVSAPPASPGSAPKCPDAAQWLLLYWAGAPTAIGEAARACTSADRFWSNQGGRWLGFSPGTPQASDTWTVQTGEAEFVHGGSQQVQAPPGTALSLSAFAKDWGRHGFGMSIDSTGRGAVSWGTYRWCTDDPTPPCDQIANNLILSGGRAVLVFNRVQGKTAYGQVTSTTDPQTLAEGPVSLVLLPYGMARLVQGSDEIDLCGPDFADLAPDSVRNTYPCGA